MHDTEFDEDKSRHFVNMRGLDPIVKYVQEYSLLHYIGQVKGKSFLDLGCGNGHYSRLLKQMDAKEVIGADISEAMIFLAKAEELKAPLGIHYLVADGRNMGNIGEFDIVLANYILNFARSIDELKAFVKTAYVNLKKGGKLVGANPNCLSQGWFDSPQKYGKTFVKMGDVPNGMRVQSTWTLPGQPEMKVLHYCYQKQVYENVFRNIGFKLRFENVLLDDAGEKAFPPEHWDDYMKCPNQVIFVAEK